MNYGLPYQGSKSRIAPEVVAMLPSATHLYDLFAGGCAITDFSLNTGKYSHYHANDITDVPQLFKMAINGEFANETRWISRADFERLKDTDPYIRICWSFGNNGKNYLYSREIEPWKKALHYARVFGDYSLLKAFGIDSNGDRNDIRKHKEEYKQKYIRWWLAQQEYTEQELDALIATTKADIYKTEEELRQYLLEALEDCGLTQSEVGKRLGTQMQTHYFGRSQWAFPTQEYYKKMQTFMPKLDKDYNEIVGLYHLQQRLESLQSLEMLESLQRLQRLQRLERLERLERLQRLERLERLERLQSLERLQRLQRLQSLQRLERLEITQADYRTIDIQPNSVIYCDIPYKGTKQYSTEFDHEAFYKWAKQQRGLVVISEYDMPSDFVCVWRKTITRKFSAQGRQQCNEGLFVPKHQLELYNERMGLARLF